MDECKIVTKITSAKDGKIYYLCDDGKLYDEEYNVLDKLNEESKRIIDEIMGKFKSGMTDVVRDDDCER